mgnify:CR=1 FL=1
MASNTKAKIIASTQEHLDLDDIIEDLVLLKTGWVAMVITTTAVNFDILSEAEQDATIFAYGAFLNSLTFPLQVLIRSKKADITAYFQHLTEAEKNQQNPDLKRQIQKYMDFIRTTVQQKTILDKHFYLVINYSPLKVGPKGSKKTKEANECRNKRQLVLDAKVALAPKRDHIIKQTARLGLTSKQLSTKELIELFYDIYNPAPTGTQRVMLDTDSYTTPIVEPAVEVPTPASMEELLNRGGQGSVQAGEANVFSNSLPQINTQAIPANQASGQPSSMGQSLAGLQAATQKASELLVNKPPINLTEVPVPPQPTDQPTDTSNQS